MSRLVEGLYWTTVAILLSAAVAASVVYGATTVGGADIPVPGAVDLIVVSLFPNFLLMGFAPLGSLLDLQGTYALVVGGTLVVHAAASGGMAWWFHRSRARDLRVRAAVLMGIIIVGVVGAAAIGPLATEAATEAVMRAALGGGPPR